MSMPLPLAKDGLSKIYRQATIQVEPNINLQDPRWDTERNEYSATAGTQTDWIMLRDEAPANICSIGIGRPW